jgi:hypothetical protein
MNQGEKGGSPTVETNCMPYRPKNIISDIPSLDISFGDLERAGEVSFSDRQREEIRTASIFYKAEKKLQQHNLPNDRQAQRYFEDVAKECLALSRLIYMSEDTSSDKHGLIFDIYPTENRHYITPYMEPDELAGHLGQIVEKANTMIKRFNNSKRGRPTNGYLDEYIMKLINIYIEAGGNSRGCIQDRAAEEGYKGPLFQFIVQIFLQVDPSYESISHIGRKIIELKPRH